MWSLTLIFVAAALVSGIVSLAGKCPVIVPVLCLAIAAALQFFPK